MEDTTSKADPVPDREMDSFHGDEWVKPWQDHRPVVRKFKFRDILPISIENEAGTIRKWKEPHTGKKGETLMRHPYGFIRHTLGADGGQIDCFVGSDDDSETLWIVRQMKPPEYKEYDEDKVMVGFTTKKHALAAYQSHRPGDHDEAIGAVEEISLDDFMSTYMKKALDAGQPMSGQQAPMMQQPPTMPGMGMGMMLPPPITDVNLIEGVQYWLGNIGNANEIKLRELAGEVWGEGYQFNAGETSLLKEELIGFLLDQKEMLEAGQQMMDPSLTNSANSQAPMPVPSSTSTSSPSLPATPSAPDGVSKPSRSEQLEQVFLKLEDLSAQESSLNQDKDSDELSE